MGASLITAPVVEPVSLSEAKAHLRQDSSDSDSSLVAYLVASRQFCESYTRRVFKSQTWSATYHGWPVVGCQYRIDFPLAPVISVSSVTYLDTDGTSQTLASDQYTLNGAGPDNIPYITPAYGVTWPSVRCVPDSVTVQFVAGYASVPQAIKVAILLNTELLYDRNPAARELLESARNALLDPHRRV